MTQTTTTPATGTSARPTGRRALHIAIAGMLIATVATVGAIVSQAGSSASPSVDAKVRDQGLPPRVPAQEGGENSNTSTNSTDASGPVSAADGGLPDGATVFDDEYPGISRLEPSLLAALRAAVADASESGIEFTVTSGWRSPAYQERLLRQAVADYGSEEEAARWVATAQTSAHVSGEAIDIGGVDAMGWLSENGAAYGLCQIYGNEPWHYELRPDAAEQGCPGMYADPTEDPRMRRS